MTYHKNIKVKNMRIFTQYFIECGIPRTQCHQAPSPSLSLFFCHLLRVLGFFQP